MNNGAFLLDKTILDIIRRYHSPFELRVPFKVFIFSCLNQVLPCDSSQLNSDTIQ